MAVGMGLTVSLVDCSPSPCGVARFGRSARRRAPCTGSRICSVSPAPPRLRRSGSCCCWRPGPGREWSRCLWPRPRSPSSGSGSRRRPRPGANLLVGAQHDVYTVLWLVVAARRCDHRDAGQPRPTVSRRAAARTRGGAPHRWPRPRWRHEPCRRAPPSRPWGSETRPAPGPACCRRRRGRPGMRDRAARRIPRGWAAIAPDRRRHREHPNRWIVSGDPHERRQQALAVEAPGRPDDEYRGGAVAVPPADDATAKAWRDEVRDWLTDGEGVGPAWSAGSNLAALRRRPDIEGRAGGREHTDQKRGQPAGSEAARRPLRAATWGHDRSGRGPLGIVRPVSRGDATCLDHVWGPRKPR